MAVLHCSMFWQKGKPKLMITIQLTLEKTQLQKRKKMQDFIFVF